MSTLSPELIDSLIKSAKRKCWGEDSEASIDDYAGGKIDDAYSGGVDDGDAWLARRILKELGVSYE